MASEITGNWQKGIAFDKHTLSSSYLGVDQFGHDRWDSTRSEMGELVYQLKYRQNTDVIPKIIDLLDRIKGIEEFDRIVPIPPTVATRPFQPVRLIAEALGQRRGVQVIPDLLTKTGSAEPLKNVTDPAKREELLKNSMTLTENHDVSGLKLLLVDDLFRSGATLSAATEILLTDAHAATVSVLTMTMTRTNR